MLKQMKLCLLMAMVPLATCVADEGIDSSDRRVKDIDMLTDGAAAVVVLYTPVRQDEIQGFNEVMRIVNENCQPPAQRSDKRNDLPAAVIIMCIEDERDVRVHGDLDKELEYVSIVAPINHEAFLRKRDLLFDSKTIDIFTNAQDGKIVFNDKRRHSVPLPLKGSGHASRVSQWKAAFEGISSGIRD